MSSLARKNTDSTVRGTLTEAAAQKQAANFVSYNREPLASEIPDQGFVLATVAGTVYIYTKLSNKRYKVAMTLV